MSIERLKKIHYSVHIKNPDINYILLENCCFCKLDRRDTFGHAFKNPRTLDAMCLTPYNYSNVPRISNYTNNNPVSRNDRVIRNYYNSSSALNQITNNPTHQPINVIRRYNTYRINRPPINTNRNVNTNVSINRHTNTNNNVINRNVNINDNISDTESETVYGFDDDELEDVRVKTYLEDVNNNSCLKIYDKINPIGCSICKENIKFCNIVRTLKCSHTFHHKCIDTWLEDHSTCPICRYQLRRRQYSIC